MFNYFYTIFRHFSVCTHILIVNIMNSCDNLTKQPESVSFVSFRSHTAQELVHIDLAMLSAHLSEVQELR